MSSPGRVCYCLSYPMFLFLSCYNYLSVARDCASTTIVKFLISTVFLFRLFLVSTLSHSKFCLVSDKIIDEITMLFFSLLLYRKSCYFIPLMVENVLLVYFSIRRFFINFHNFHVPSSQCHKYLYIITVLSFQRQKYLDIGLSV